MERRSFVRGAGLAGVLAAGVAPAVVHAQAALRWRLTSAFPKSLDTIYGASDTFARKVKDMTGGKFEISVHAAGELVPMPGLVDAVQNIYDGPDIYTANIVAQNSLTGAFEFHPEHNHWHLKAVNQFEVRKALDDGSGGQWNQKATIGQVLKETFCLIDYVPMNDDQLADFGLPELRRRYFDCFATQGISPGWIDYYHHSTHEQFVDITGAKAGIYYLILTFNPDGIFVESNRANNRAWVSFRLDYNGKNNAIVTVLFDSLTQAGEGLEPPSNTNR